MAGGMAAKPPGGGRVGVCWVVMGIGEMRRGRVAAQSSMRVRRGLAALKTAAACGWDLIDSRFY